jgi:hypothetical protein
MPIHKQGLTIVVCGCAGWAKQSVRLAARNGSSIQSWSEHTPYGERVPVDC